MIGETRYTAGDLSGYVHFEAYAGGYTCPSCGSWVAYNTFHSCYNVSPPYYYGYVPTFNPVLDEIKGLLEQILELLS